MSFGQFHTALGSLSLSLFVILGLDLNLIVPPSYLHGIKIGRNFVLIPRANQML